MRVLISGMLRGVWLRMIKFKVGRLELGREKGKGSGEAKFY